MTTSRIPGSLRSRRAASSRTRRGSPTGDRRASRCKDILACGAGAIESGGGKLTEEQVNRVGYWLLGKKKVRESVAVFERNAKDHPDSWNVHDSLGEAYAEDGQRDRAIASYEESLALNPANSNGVESLRKLKTGS